ncbi:MAG TPA: methyltransferase domain-containing protein [Thermoleophilaceae bacterium]|nr:methyltransferase domain-containing protein [Thermoleophilaceae bacterium]
MSEAAAPRDWDADTYDRVSAPQVEWAEAVLDRLELAGHETVLDAGCGSGRVTRMLLERLPRGRVVAVDAAPSMVARARQALPADRVTVIAADLAELELEQPVDAIFSNAVFHWVPDHERLFTCMYAASRPGGRLVAQCGGQGNVERFHTVVRAVGEQAPFAPDLAGWTGPWNFASPEDTVERLERAGFAEVEVWREPHPVVPEYTEEYLRTVCLGHHLERLPAELRESFVSAVAARCGRPLELDYVRLNITARRPAPIAQSS